jgi:hypothetical protein
MDDVECQSVAWQAVGNLKWVRMDANLGLGQTDWISDRSLLLASIRGLMLNFLIFPDQLM